MLVRPAKAGLGAAYRAGFVWALDRGYVAVVQMHADLSHPPETVPALVDALENCDVAVGSRYVSGGSVRNWSLSRRLISRLGNAYVNLVLGLGVRDATAGFKAFRADALETIGAVGSQSNGYCFQIENTWQAVQHGLRVTEVPITFTDRTRGPSKMSGAIVAEAVVRVLGWRLREPSGGVGRRGSASYVVGVRATNPHDLAQDVIRGGCQDDHSYDVPTGALDETHTRTGPHWDPVLVTRRWRRDLNPRLTCANKRFRGVLLRPLGHATAGKVTGRVGRARNQPGSGADQRWVRKNASSRAALSSARTPPTTSGRWLSRRSRTTSQSDPTAPALSS